VSGPFLLLVAVFFVLTVARVPIAFAMLVAALAYLAAAGRDLGLVADQVMNTLMINYLLVAIPMFLLAANLMNAGSISDRLFAACHVLVGRIRGGLAQIDVLVSVVFASMNGSAVADAAGPGLVTIARWEGRLSARLRRGDARASLGARPDHPAFHPDGALCTDHNASVAALFLGGVVPGLLMAAAMMVVVAITAKAQLPVKAPVPAARGRALSPAPCCRSAPVVLAASTAACSADRGRGGGLCPAARRRGLPRLSGEPVRAFLETDRQSAVILLMIAARSPSTTR
jgi:TRAP-type mannitol/chloroaromatic compound transport system permease large subunit